MSALDRLRTLLQRSRARRAAIALAQALPIGLALALIAERLLALSAVSAAIAVLLAVMAAVWSARHAFVSLDAAWLDRQLNQLQPEFEDSVGLLWSAPQTLSGLGRLQRQRIATRITNAPLPDLSPPWPWRRLLLIWTASVLLGLLALLAPATLNPVPDGSLIGTTLQPGPPAALSVVDARVELYPPAYTGLPDSTLRGLNATVAEGAMLRWAIELDVQPDRAWLEFHDGSQVALLLQNGRWQGERRIDAPLLYRLNTEAGTPLREADAGLNRIQIIPDQAPRLRVFEPDRTLSLVEPGQRDWALDVEASDDYGLGDARLSITLAHGTGENVIFRETVQTLSGQGEARHKRYRHRIALTEAGFEPGDDLILRLSVEDNRTPTANTTRHPSLILRWPLAQGGAAGTLDGVVRDVLPAYFRSQRQIIIDTEALLAERDTLDDPSFIDRADAIGIDQRILRLRYGQFLGEETELEAPAGRVARVDDDDDDDDDDHDDHRADADHVGHDHDDAEPTRAASFGEIENVLAEYGHTHDYSEAATLFDVTTRELLRAALNAMWLAELQLRTGQPAAALPHEYQALEFIKQVQQANRIYLARVGLELPPIDFGRRLSGDLADVEAGPDPLAASEQRLDWLVELWTTLQRGLPTDLEPLERWLAQSPAPVANPIDLLSAVDRLRRDPDCRDCAHALAGQLWPLLPRPTAQVPTRERPNAAGQRYLDALQATSSERGDRP